MGAVVAGKIRVFAYPNPSSVGHHTGGVPDAGCWPRAQLSAADIARTTARVALVSPEYYIIGYDDLNQLISQIQILLSTLTWTTGTPPVKHHNPCLETLEINSHANDQKCGGICPGNMTPFANAVDGLNYCDELSIYLSGCNTGCGDGSCIANSLAQLIPSVRRHKQYRCTVYGTKGYQTGSNAGKNSKVTRDFTDSHGIYHGPYPNSENQSLPRKTMSRVDDPTYRGFRGPNSA